MAHHTTEDRATADAFAPTVRFVPCAEFRVDYDSPWAVCVTCGWLDDDHARSETPSAVVTDLPRRRRVLLPERKAS
jgi:hypothetical protein